MDFVEGLPRSEGKDCILVVVDRFTKFAHFLSLSHPYTTQEVAKVFLDQVVKIHGVPRTIISDRDKVFTSLMWQSLLKSLGSKLSMSSACHPQTDGQIERVNQCLENYLRCLCFHHPMSWHKWLSLAQWWCNSSHHTAIRMSPFEALFGYKPPLLPAIQEITNVAAIEEHLQQRQEILGQLKKDLAMAQNRMRQQADKGRSEREFAVGEEVYLRLRPTHIRVLTSTPVTKLSPKYYGPFPIEAKLGKVAYRLLLLKNSCIHPVFHLSCIPIEEGCWRSAGECKSAPRYWQQYTLSKTHGCSR